MRGLGHPGFSPAIIPHEVPPAKTAQVPRAASPSPSTSSPIPPATSRSTCWPPSSPSSPPDAFILRRQSFLQSEPLLRSALEHVAADPGLVFHAFVSRQFKELIAEHCKQFKLACCDLTGTFVDFIARESGISPQANIARLHDVSHEYNQRIKALEFTLEHDDGLGADTLNQADIILVGVSRTSKTPTSIYLAQQGYRVANVSLAPGSPPAATAQPALAQHRRPGHRPPRLSEIRTNRQVEWRMAGTSYNDIDCIKQEVLESRRLFLQHGWPILDITGRAVEETAARVIHMLGLSGPLS